MPFRFDKLRILLRVRNMTARDLCQKTHISGATMAKIWKGQSVRLETLGRICEALSVRLDDIVEYQLDHPSEDIR